MLLIEHVRLGVTLRQVNPNVASIFGGPEFPPPAPINDHEPRCPSVEGRRAIMHIHREVKHG